MLKSNLLFLFVCCSIFLYGQNDPSTGQLNAKFSQMIKETQNSKSTSGIMQLGWWFPFELWETIIDLDPSTSAKDKADIKNIVKPYTFFAVAHGKLNDSTDPSKINFEYSDKETIAQSLSLIGNDGKIYKPLNEQELDYQLQTILELFTPIFSNMMGDLGKNFHFFVFTDRRGSLPRISDPKKKGEVIFYAENVEYKFTTPLPSVVPKKQCPIDNEMMNGTWNYCPLHGETLLEINE